MGKIIQCGWNLSDEVFLTDFSKKSLELEESKAVFIVNASADFSRGVKIQKIIFFLQMLWTANISLWNRAVTV